MRCANNLTFICVEFNVVTMGRERAGEDAVSMLMDMLDSLAERAGKMNRKLVAAFFALMVWVVIEGVLWALSLVSISPIEIITTGVLLALALFVIGELLEIRGMLAELVARYSAYRFAREENFAVPEGKDPVERLLRYFNTRMGLEEKLRRRGTVRRNADVEGVSGTYRFDLWAQMKVSPIRRIVGHRDYALYVRFYDHVPDVEDIEGFVSEVMDCVKRTGVRPSRVVALCRGEGEIGDELYEKLISMKWDIPVQVIMEMPDGTYDFIPFIAPRHDGLP